MWSQRPQLNRLASLWQCFLLLGKCHLQPHDKEKQAAQLCLVQLVLAIVGPKLARADLVAMLLLLLLPLPPPLLLPLRAAPDLKFGTIRQLAGNLAEGPTNHNARSQRTHCLLLCWPECCMEALLQPRDCSQQLQRQHQVRLAPQLLGRSHLASPVLPWPIHEQCVLSMQPGQLDNPRQVRLQNEGEHL
jgi:hypothetical protein